MTKELNIAIAGIGTVGGGVASILQEKAALLEERAGCTLVLRAVSGRNKARSHALDMRAVAWVDDAMQLTQDPGIDLIVEAIGGSDGIAFSLCEAALKNGKHVVTANKALLAHHGVYLAELAEKHQVCLMFEAAVAGGIPVIKTLKEGLAANRFSRICGILNGTSNYILTTMQETGRAFADVLKEAQDLGYAEADPSFDVDGVDAAHKLALLAALAYGCAVNFAAVYREGIRHITPHDMRLAAELGFAVKLLGICEMTEEGLSQQVHPCLVPKENPIASVSGVFNAVVIEGDSVGRLMLEGRGAGSGPTASAVVADIVDIASGRGSLPFNRKTHNLQQVPYTSIASHRGAYYMRLVVQDKPGVLADITDILKSEAISVESLLQKAHKQEEAVHIMIVTHVTNEKAVQRAISRMKTLESVLESPHIIRICA